MSDFEGNLKRTLEETTLFDPSVASAMVFAEERRQDLEFNFTSRARRGYRRFERDLRAA
jgi:hypothetical protein